MTITSIRWIGGPGVVVATVGEAGVGLGLGFNVGVGAGLNVADVTAPEGGGDNDGRAPLPGGVTGIHQLIAATTIPRILAATPTPAHQLEPRIPNLGLGDGDRLTMMRDVTRRLEWQSSDSFPTIRPVTNHERQDLRWLDRWPSRRR